jgi:hypothetical protein
MLVIAGSANKELARQVSYLKAENQMLRPPVVLASRFGDKRARAHERAVKTASEEN